MYVYRYIPKNYLAATWALWQLPFIQFHLATLWDTTERFMAGLDDFSNTGMSH